MSSSSSSSTVPPSASDSSSPTSMSSSKESSTTSADTSTVTTFSSPLTTSQSSTSTTTANDTTTLSQSTSSQLPTTLSSSPPTISSSQTQTTTFSSPTISSSPTTSSSSTTSTIHITTNAPPSTSTSTSTSTSPNTSSSSVIPVSVVTTLESTIFITTTNSQGQAFTTAPSIVTELTTSTNSAGAATTITQGVANPTLEPNNGTSSDSAFFSNTSAVVGVFVVVGLAAASIVLWIFFFIRRKRRMRWIDQDTEVEAATAAAGFGRAPLDDDNDNRSPFSTEIGRRGNPLSHVPDGSGLPTTAGGLVISGRPSSYDNAANLYAGHPVQGQPIVMGAGYMQARTASPPPGAEQQGPCSLGTDDMGDSSRDRISSYGHTPTYSVGSYEPLLAAYAQGSSAERGAVLPPTSPPRNPRPLHDASPEHVDDVASRPANGYSSDGSADDRLDPEMRRRTRSDSLGSDDLRDDEDYSRPMLTVRNMPDSHSTRSAT